MHCDDPGDGVIDAVDCALGVVVLTGDKDSVGSAAMIVAVLVLI